MRSEFSWATKMQALERASHQCQGVDGDGDRCGRNDTCYLMHFDHIIPDGLGGPNTVDNCAVLCYEHHRAKTTKLDVPRIAKMKRQAKHHATGRSRARKGPPIPGSKDTKWKRKISGKTVLRD